jgi:hypothetical protein
VVENAHQRLDGILARLEFQRHRHAGGSSGGCIFTSSMSTISSIDSGGSRTRIRTRTRTRHQSLVVLHSNANPRTGQITLAPVRDGPTIGTLVGGAPASRQIMILMLGVVDMFGIGIGIVIIIVVVDIIMTMTTMNMASTGRP